ncbi:hypothetical protein DENSPDRAFT_880164 [Dentipellis sp. KUC8613]|nr:hypothetical protein DENSPDRAFT_880164 [Dentipellis sp. KUC8613]
MPSRMLPPAASSERHITPSRALVAPLLAVLHAARSRPSCSPVPAIIPPSRTSCLHAPSCALPCVPSCCRHTLSHCRHPPSRHDLLPVTPSCALWYATLRITPSEAVVAPARCLAPRAGPAPLAPISPHHPIVAPSRLIVVTFAP